MKNVFTYSLIGLSLSLISCSKNNSPKKNANETAEFTPIEDNTPPSTPADGNKDKPINEDNKPDAKDGGYAPKSKLNGIYAYNDKPDSYDFILYKYTEDNFIECNGNYNNKESIKSQSFPLSWFGQNNYLIHLSYSLRRFEITKEEVKKDGKIFRIEYTQDSQKYYYLITDNLKIINNHEEIIKDCKF